MATSLLTPKDKKKINDSSHDGHLADGSNASDSQADGASGGVNVGVRKKRKLPQQEQDMSQLQKESKEDRDGGLGDRDTPSARNVNGSMSSNDPLSESKNACSERQSIKLVDGVENENVSAANSSHPQEDAPGSTQMDNLSLISSIDKAKEKKRNETILVQLSHRILLLERLRLCREATEKRLTLMYRDEEKEKTQNERTIKDKRGAPIEKSKTDNSNVNSDVKSSLDLKEIRKTKDSTEMDEIEAFRNMCRAALQYTVKRPPVAERSSSNVSSRGSISLRKGASVGKKMQAAVSTLTSNVGWISDSSSSSSQNPQHKNVASTSPQPHLSISNENASSSISVASAFSNPLLKQSLSSSISVGSGNLNNGSLSIHPDGIKSAHLSFATNSSDPNSKRGISPLAKSNLIAKSSSHGTGKQLKTKKNHLVSSFHSNMTVPGLQGQKHKRMGNNKNIRLASNSCSTSEVGSTSVAPLHYGLKNESEFLAQHHKSGTPTAFGNTKRILCPETDKLRKRRRAIESKLENLYHKRYVQVLKKKLKGKFHQGSSFPATNYESGSVVAYKVNKSMGVGKPISFTFPPPTDENTYLGSNKNSWKNVMGLELGCCRLPGRKKTQWDYVLEEMRWLSTDFIEERKWKIASSCAISSSMKSSINVKSSPSRRSPLKKINEGRPPSAGLTESSVCIEVNKCALGEKDAIQNKEKAVGMVMEEESIVAPSGESDGVEIVSGKYREPSFEDIECAQSIAKVLGMIVADHWDLVAHKKVTDVDKSSCDIDSYSSAFNRYRKLRLKLDKQITAGTKEESSQNFLSIDHIEKPNESIEVSKEGNRCCDVCISNERNFTYDDVTQHIDSQQKYVSDVRKRLESESVQHLEEEINGKLKKSGLELHYGQIKSIKFIEELWKKDADLDCSVSGAVLSGSYGSGKTLSIATLIWRRRLLGPQLLLCQPGSVIRWRHEFRRFDGLNVLTFGPHGWSYDKYSLYAESSGGNPYKDCDVIVCEFSTVMELLKNVSSRKENGIKGKMGSESVYFSTVAVDTRCTFSSTFLSDGTELCGNSISKKKKKRRKNACHKNFSDDVTNHIAPELISSKWWNELLLYLTAGDSKRIIVESSGFRSLDKTNFYFSDQSNDDKQRAEIISLKVVFLYHPIFQSLNTTVGKRALGWAKKYISHIKTVPQGHGFNASEASLSDYKKTGGARGILLKSIKSVTHDQECLQFSQKEKDVETPGERIALRCAFPPKWSIRMCPLPPSQRIAYDKTCSFVRGSFSLSSSNLSLGDVTNEKAIKTSDIDSIDIERISCSDMHISSAKALLRLRRTCFHSDLHDLIWSNIDGFVGQKEWRNKMYPKKRKFCDQSSRILKKEETSYVCCNNRLMTSPSQPNLEVANHFLENSSKLKELLVILCEECGYDIAHEACLLNSLRHEKPKVKLTRRKKVLILATLPEVLYMTSKFLNAVGISNELLMSSSLLLRGYELNFGTSVSASGRQYSSGHSPICADFTLNESSFSWIKSQEALARFEIDDNEGVQTISQRNYDQGATNSFDIILASPATIGSTSLGLSASNADVIISLDEDWSGRGQLQVYSILMKNCMKHHNTLQSRPQSFIKLLSERTCEQVFLTAESKSKRETCVSPVPISMASIQMSRVDIYGNLVVSSPQKVSGGTPESLAFDGSSLSTKTLSSTQYSGCLLGSNILRFQNVPLSAVLRTNYALPPDSVTGCHSLFLANSVQKTDENELESNNSQHDVPALLDDTSEHLKIVQSAKSLKNALSFGLSLTKVESLSNLLCLSCPRCQCGNYLQNTNDQNQKLIRMMKPIFPPVPANFTQLIATSRDLISRGIQLYVEHFKIGMFWYGVDFRRSDVSHVLSQQPATTTASNESPSLEADNKSGTKKADVELSSNLHQSGLGKKSENLAMSLLIYSLPGADRQKNDSLQSSTNSKGEIEGTGIVGGSEVNSKIKFGSSSYQSQKRKRKRDHNNFILPVDNQRKSNFVFSYCHMRQNPDGHQGRESLIYFPPLLPNLLSNNYFPDRSKEDSMELPGGEAFDSMLGTATQSSLHNQKRKTYLDAGSPNSKRIRKSNNLSSPVGDLPMPTGDASPLHLSSALSTTLSMVPSSTFPAPPLEDSFEVKDFSDDLKLMPENDPDLVDSASALLDSDFMADITMKKDVVDDVKEDNKFSSDEDVGILGSVALSSSRDSVTSPNKEKIETNSYSFWYDPFEPQTSDNLLSTVGLCDQEEATSLLPNISNGPFLNSVILHVKRRPRTLHGSIRDDSAHSLHMPGIQRKHAAIVASPPYLVHGGAPSSSPQGLQTNQAMTYKSSDLPNGVIDPSSNFNSAQKKKKKSNDRRPSVLSGASFATATTLELTHVAPFGGNTPIGNSIGRPVKETKFFSQKSRKYSGASAIMLPNVQSSLQYVRLIHGLTDRISGHTRTLLSTNKNSCSISTLIDSSSAQKIVMDSAQTVPITMVPTSHHSLFVPSKVNFGPFHIGCVPPSNLNDKAKAHPTRDGIGLPMGVKIPRRYEESQQEFASIYDSSSDKWSSKEDDFLKEYAHQFGFNWHIICRAMARNCKSEFESTSNICSEREVRHQTIRSARQCKSRWDSIAQKRNLEKGKAEDSDNTVVTNESNLNEASAKAPYIVSTLTSSGHTVMSNRQSKAVTCESIIVDHNIISINQKRDESGSTQVRNRLMRMKKSSLKRQRVPLTLPGCNSGSIVPTHHSHSQSVQAAVALSAGSSGIVRSRAEMWPLQFLDLAEKQRRHQTSGSIQQPVAVSQSQQSQNQGALHHAQQPQQSQNKSNLHKTQQSHQPQNQGSLHRTQQPQQSQNQSALHHKKQPQQMQTSHQPSGITTPVHAVNQQQDLVKQAARAAALSSPSKVRSGKNPVVVQSAGMPHTSSQSLQTMTSSQQLQGVGQTTSAPYGHAVRSSLPQHSTQQRSVPLPQAPNANNNTTSHPQG